MNIKAHSYSTTEVIRAIRRGMFNLGVIRYSVEDTELSFKPSYMGNEVPNGTLVALPIEHNPFPMRQSFLVYNKKKLNPVDQMFYDYLFATPARKQQDRE